MNGEKSCEGCVIYGKAASYSFYEGFANIWDGGKEVCDYSGSSESYLASWKDIA